MIIKYNKELNIDDEYNKFEIIINKDELIKLYERLNNLYNENIYNIEDIKKSEKEIFISSNDKLDFILNDFEFYSMIDNNFIDNKKEIQEFNIDEIII